MVDERKKLVSFLHKEQINIKPPVFYCFRQHAVPQLLVRVQRLVPPLREPCGREDIPGRGRDV